jgi:outer membrane protein assembly factor BamB
MIWDQEVLHHAAATLPGIHGKNRQASPTPIYRDGRIYAHFGHLGTVALDATAGEVRWRQKDLSYEPVHGNGGSPALVGDALIFSRDAAKDPEVVALGAADGLVRWRTPRNTVAKRTFSFCTPLAVQIDGSTQVILPGSGFVAGYAPADGKELWRVRYGEGYSVVPRPIFSHGLLFLGTGYDRPSVFAVRPGGAKGDATETAIAWQTAKAAPNTPSLIAVADEVYFVSDGGIATCVEATTGKVYWSERLGGDFSASPVYADERLYFQNETGTGFVVKPGRDYELLAKNELGERTLASYAVTEGALFIRGEAHLFRIGKGK